MECGEVAGIVSERMVLIQEIYERETLKHHHAIDMRDVCVYTTKFTRAECHGMRMNLLHIL